MTDFLAIDSHADELGVTPTFDGTGVVVSASDFTDGQVAAVHLDWSDTARLAAHLTRLIERHARDGVIA